MSGLVWWLALAATASLLWVWSLTQPTLLDPNPNEAVHVAAKEIGATPECACGAGTMTVERAHRHRTRVVCLYSCSVCERQLLHVVDRTAS